MKLCSMKAVIAPQRYCLRNASASIWITKTKSGAVERDSGNLSAFRLLDFKEAGGTNRTDTKAFRKLKSFPFVRW